MTNSFFQHQTPLGKLPTIEDGDVEMCESGAIVEYILEAAGIMMGFTMIAAQLVGVLDERFSVLGAYLERLRERPAFNKAMATT